MALDGVFLHYLTEELQSEIGSFVDKIHQPSKTELVLMLRRAGSVKRLLISVASGKARLHFTEQKTDNPPTPPMFCMLLRKYLGNSKLLSVTQEGLDRVIKLTFSAVNEMGDITELSLYVELISSAPNVILVDKDNRIIDALRRSSLEDEGRIIHSGAYYFMPDKPDKLNPLSCSVNDILERVYSYNSFLDKALLNSVEGLSPLVCRETVNAISNDGDISVSDLTGYHKNMLEAALKELLKQIKSEGKPYLIEDKDGKPFEFSYMPIKQYGGKSTITEGFSALLDEFYAAGFKRDRIKTAAEDILKLLTVLSSRTAKRKALRENDLKKCADREKYRIYGELIKANIYNISRGQTSVELQNYYDENLSFVKIPLNPELSPADNAAKYFKTYKKTHTAEQTLLRLIEEDEAELVYFDSVLDSITRAETAADISEIRDELALGGYIKRPVGYRQKKNDSKFLKFVSPSGYTVLIGKNNRQNDALTLKTAAKNDLWFHVKSIAGSHVILCCGGCDVRDEDIIFAAKKAAEHSKAKDSSNVAVDYTAVKYVKKPAGAKAGMVIYSTNKTVYVTP